MGLCLQISSESTDCSSGLCCGLFHRHTNPDRTQRPEIELVPVRSVCDFTRLKRIRAVTPEKTCPICCCCPPRPLSVRSAMFWLLWRSARERHVGVLWSEGPASCWECVTDSRVFGGEGIVSILLVFLAQSRWTWPRKDWRVDSV